jgi:hypothetical protein
MRLALKLLAGAALCATLATLDTRPAAAAEHEFGSVNVAAGHYTDVRWSRFGGPLDHITFVPVNDAIDCEHVTINYLDGTTHDVFSGTVLAGARTTISLPPPNDGRVHDVTFACKAHTVDGARIALSAVTDAWPRGWDADRPAHVVTEAHSE